MTCIRLLAGEPPPGDGVLYRAWRDDVTFRYVAIAQGDGYEVVHEDGEPDGGDGTAVIAVYAGGEGFLEDWRAVRDALATHRGYLGTRLYRGAGGFVELARWSSPLMYSRARPQAPPLGGDVALYERVRP